MTQHPVILAFAGSLRAESFNKRLLRAAMEHVRALGAEVVHVDLRDYVMPLYDGDHEAEYGVPEAARRLRKLMLGCHGMLIASPEYNGSVSGVLKNTLDWCSRPADDVAGLAPFSGKAVALVAASPSPFGGVRGLGHLRAIMGKLGSVVLAEDVALPFAGNAFEGDHGLAAAPAREQVRLVGAGLVRLAARLHGLGTDAATS
jgi:NAD(P)H-dependent FMN reductase